MGRPKAVNFNTFGEYNLLHTTKTMMMSGVSITTLYPIKETAEFYRSIEVWAHCASVFKMKKKNGTLSVTIPTITDEKTIAFLNKNCWADHVKKNTDNPKSDIAYTVALLDKLFPDKEKKFFYELDSLISAYIEGNFECFDPETGVPEELGKHDLEMQRYYNHKYNRAPLFKTVPEIKALYDIYEQETDESKKQGLFGKYHDAEEAYVFEHCNLVPQMTEIGRNAVCYPVAFERGTADWHLKEYGKPCAYAHAGEIFFVVTPDTVFFNPKRHY